jgi:hypothetical protein
MSVWNGKQDLTIVQADVADIKNDMNVPAQNSADDILIRDVVGNKTDTHLGTSVYSLLQTINEHIHSRVRCYPTLANGIVVTGGVAPWALGAFAVVVPANTITADFDIHHINVAAYNANDTFELVLYSGADGAEIEIGRVRFTRITNVGASPHIPFQTSVIAANSQIKAKISSLNGTSNTATISLMYHHY